METLRRRKGTVLLVLFLLTLAVALVYCSTSAVFTTTPENFAPRVAEVKMLEWESRKVGPYYHFPPPYQLFPHGVAAYRSETGSGDDYPKYRTWNGAYWSSEEELPENFGTPRWVVAKHFPFYCERLEEWIFVVCDVEGWLSAYVWDGENWIIENRFAQTVTINRAFDLAYEQKSGDALLVYSTGGIDPELKYRIWNGENWSSPASLDLTTEDEVVRLVRMDSNPLSDEICMVVVNAAPTAIAVVWDGQSWGNEQLLSDRGDAYSSTTWSADLAYEQESGSCLVVFSDSPGTAAYTWDGTTWTLVAGWVLEPPHEALVIELEPQPKSDNIMAIAIMETEEYLRSLWDGSSFTGTETTGIVSTYPENRTYDLAWEPEGEELLWAYQDDANPGTLQYQTWTPAGGWGTLSGSIQTGGSPTWVELIPGSEHPRDTGVLGAYLTDNFDLGGAWWTGDELVNLGSQRFTALAGERYTKVFDLTNQGVDHGNLYLIRPSPQYRRGLWIQVELVNRWEIDNFYLVFEENVGVYRVTTDNSELWENDDYWVPVQQENMSKSGKPIEFQVPEVYVSYDYPLVIAIDNMYYEVRPENAENVCVGAYHYVSVEEGDY